MIKELFSRTKQFSIYCNSFNNLIASSSVFKPKIQFKMFAFARNFTCFKTGLSELLGALMSFAAACTKIKISFYIFFCFQKLWSLRGITTTGESIFKSAPVNPSAILGSNSPFVKNTFVT